MKLEEIQGITTIIKVHDMYPKWLLEKHIERGHFKRYKFELRVPQDKERYLSVVHPVIIEMRTTSPRLVVVGENTIAEQVYGRKEDEIVIPKGWKSLGLAPVKETDRYLDPEDLFLQTAYKGCTAIGEPRIIVEPKVRPLHFVAEKEPRLPKKGEWYVAQNTWRQADEDFRIYKMICARPIYAQDFS